MQAGRLAKAVKKALPHSKAIIGGVHASVLPERTLREFTAFDYAVIGEGDITIVELVHFLESHSSESFPFEIPGVAFLDGDSRYVQNKPRDIIRDLDSLPPPAWDMFRPAKEYIIHTQKGCPYHCPFCTNPNGTTIRAESAERVIQQFSELHEKYGCQSIGIGDEVFTLNKKRTIQICQQLRDTGLAAKVKWNCSTHINSMDDDIAQAVVYGGCSLVGLGIESGDLERLNSIGKGTTVEKIFSTVDTLKRNKVPFAAYCILGQPDETAQSARQLVDFAVKINPTAPVFGIMVPYPGTEIGRMAEAGLGGYKLIAKDWNDYNKQIGNAVEFDGVQRKTLERIQLFGYLKVYLYNWRIRDLLRMSWQYSSLIFSLLKKSFKRGSA